ncbi:MAG: cytochrome c [Candidatus Caldarchaeum sp.]|nr:cytochrome c [Candidatus Caldarchaeum sp.]
MVLGIGVVALTLSASLISCGRQETTGAGGIASKPGETSKSPAASKPSTTDPEALKGKILFAQTGCHACHMNPATGKDYPDLRGLYGSTVKLRDGTTVKVDDAYLRESIVDPNKKIVAGYQPSMPAYAYLKEDDIKALIAYIKSLKDEKPEFVKSEAASAK